MSYTPPAGNLVNFSLVLYSPPAGNICNFELAIIPAHRKLFSFGASKKIGKPGMPNPEGHFGIYQMRMTKQGKVPIRMKFYVPYNPQTEVQQANRQKFADAMTAWKALTDSEKIIYNERARHIGLFGRNLFIREYYSSN